MSANGAAPAEVEAHVSCRFYVRVAGKAQRAVFTEVSGLQLETDVQEYAEGGNNGYVLRLPGRTKFGLLTLKRGATASNELFDWFADVLRGKATRQHVTIDMYDAAGGLVLSWSFRNAYPVRWVGPQFTAAGAAVAVETLELAHEGIL